MALRTYFDVDPAGLHLPRERIDGADLAKLQRQIARYGRSLAGMQPVLVYRGSDGELMLSDGVTRATRAAKLSPGSLIRAELLGCRGAPSYSAREAPMIDSTRDELLETLAELRRALPSMRLGQLIVNMATVARGTATGAVWDAEDDELLSAMRWQLEQLASPTPAQSTS